MPPKLPTQSPPLNEHVLEEIFSIVYDTSYSTVKSLLLTSHLFYEITRPLLYRHIGINVATDSFKEEVESWLVDPEKLAIPKVIHHLSIYSERYFRLEAVTKHPSMRVIGGPPRKSNQGDHTIDFSIYHKERDRDSEWSIMARLVSQTTQLRSLSFSCPQAIPLILLQSIHNNPTDIHLNIASWTRVSPSMSHTDTTELALLGSPSLRSLQATIHNPEYSPRDLRLPAFWRLVRSAPNLRSARLNIISHVGCVIQCEQPEEIQAWEDLASEFECATLSHGDLPSGIRNLRITGADLSMFKDRELSHLTTLDCSKDLPFEIFHSLTSLTHLILRGDYNFIDDLLIACRPLTLLSVVGWRKCLQLDTILTHHGHSLRALALHEFERNDYANTREALNHDELLCLRDGLSHLEELSIDLNIPEGPDIPLLNDLTTDIHREIYDTLSTFPSLRRLQLNYNIGISSYDNPTRCTYDRSPIDESEVPFVDESFVKSVWAAINLGRTTSLGTVQELRVSQGESQRSTGRGFPAGWVLWEERSHRWFKATRSERDDEPDKTIISMHRDVPDFTDDLWRECRW